MQQGGKQCRTTTQHCCIGRERRLKENLCSPEHIRNEEIWKVSGTLTGIPASPLTASQTAPAPAPTNRISAGPHRGRLPAPPLVLCQCLKGNVVCLSLCSSRCESQCVLPALHLFNLQRENRDHNSLPELQQLQGI